MTDAENLYIGEDACGRIWQSFEYTGEDGYIEATVHNSHKFGNETAVDELLSSMNVYAGDYFEKMALSSGQSERLLAIIIIICAFIVLGIAIFSALLYPGIFRKALFGGLLTLSAGIFFLITSRAFYLWFDRVFVNTLMSGLCVMTYFLFAFLLVRELLSGKKQRVAHVISLLYALFISVLVGVSLFSKIYFYDMLGVWVVGAAAVAVIFIVLALLSVKQAKTISIKWLQ
jgi:hypothetical protein